MKIWTVELKDVFGDYGETHFNVVAETYNEAWDKAVQLEDEKEIKMIYLSRVV